MWHRILQSRASRLRNRNVEQHGTFPPSPTTEREFASVTMGVVSAYPQAKEKEDVYVRIPNEFGEAVKGYENVMNGATELARRMQKPRKVDVELLKSAGIYLAGRRRVGTIMMQEDRRGTHEVHTDNDWQGCPDAPKSTSGWMLTWHGQVCLRGRRRKPEFQRLLRRLSSRRRSREKSRWHTRRKC